MIFVLLYLYLFSDDISEKLNPLIQKINRKINILKKNQKYKEKKDEEKRLYEKKKTELKQNEEYKKLLSTKFIAQKQEIIDITKQIQELFSKRKKLIQYIKNEKAKIIKMKKNNDKAIAELEKKLGIKSSKKKIEENKVKNIMNKNDDIDEEDI